MNLPDPRFTDELSVLVCHELLQSETPPLLIDCREPEEFAYCRIDNALLVPLSDFANAAENILPVIDTPIIVYCHHGIRSLRATHYLRQLGHQFAYSMSQGIDQWSLQIDPKVPRY